MVAVVVAVVVAAAAVAKGVVVAGVGGLAKAKNINVTQADIDELMRKFRYVFPATSTTSLQRDFHDGKPTELEMFSGYIIKEADRLNVPVPLTKELYTQLLKRI